MTPLAYPPQDPADLRAQSVREWFERMRSAHVRCRLAWDRYTSAAIYGRADFGPVGDAEADFRRITTEAQGAILTALEDAEVPAIHEVRR